jgi:hypothetical protein
MLLDVRQGSVATQVPLRSCRWERLKRVRLFGLLHGFGLLKFRLSPLDQYDSQRDLFGFPLLSLPHISPTRGLMRTMGKGGYASVLSGIIKLIPLPSFCRQALSMLFLGLWRQRKKDFRGVPQILVPVPLPQLGL